MLDLSQIYENALYTIGRVTIDCFDHQIVVSRRKCPLSVEQAKTLAAILDHSRDGSRVSKDTLANSLGISAQQLNEILDSLMDRLSKMSIANEGGLDSAFEYPTIYADQLFIIESDLVGFNKYLAENIQEDGYTTEVVACRLEGLPIAVRLG